MVQGLGGVGHNPNDRLTVAPKAAPARIKGSEGLDGKNDVFGADFEQALKSLENAKAHISSARSYLNTAQQVRPNPRAPEDASGIDISV